MSRWEEVNPVCNSAWLEDAAQELTIVRQITDWAAFAWHIQLAIARQPLRKPRRSTAHPCPPSCAHSGALPFAEAGVAQEPAGPGSELDKGTFRADSLRVTLGLEHASAALVDDRYGNNIEVMALQLQVRPASCDAQSVKK